MTYAEKLKDPKWQKKRLEIFERDKWKCVRCNCSSKTLHVHHSYYARGLEPWDYPSDSLKTLCEGCHTAEHSPVKETRALPDGPPAAEIWTVRFLLFGGECASFIRENLDEEWIKSDLSNHIKLLMDDGLSDESMNEIFFDCQKRFPNEFTEFSLKDAINVAREVLALLRRRHIDWLITKIARQMAEPDADLSALLKEQKLLRASRNVDLFSVCEE